MGIQFDLRRTHSSSRKAILFAGDISRDITMFVPSVPGVDEKIHASSTIETTGGVIANSAVAAKRAGADVRLLIQIGNDNRAESAAADLRREGIELMLAKAEGATCLAVSIVEPHGEKRLFLQPGVSMYPSTDSIRFADLDGISWVHTAPFERQSTLLIDRCIALGIPWSIDLEPATLEMGDNVLVPLLSGCALVFCNDHAARLLGPNPVARLLASGARSVIRTRGATGAEWHGNEYLFCAPPSDIKIVDTTGAGDCLAGWVLAGIVTGRDRDQCLRDAVLAATVSCTRSGAQSSFPSRSELPFWLAEPTSGLLEANLA